MSELIGDNTRQSGPKQIHLHPHNYYKKNRSSWEVRPYAYVDRGDINLDFYKGHFRDRHLCTKKSGDPDWYDGYNEIHFVKIAGRSEYTDTQNYNNNYTHWQQSKKWEFHKTRPSDDKIHSFFRGSRISGMTSASFYQKAHNLKDHERKLSTIYMRTTNSSGSNVTSGLNFGRQSFDLSKDAADRFVDINNMVSNVISDQMVGNFQKNVIGFSCKISPIGSNDDKDNMGTVSKVGLIYAAVKQDGSNYLDKKRGAGANNLFCVECTRQLSDYGYKENNGNKNDTRDLTYVISKADWDMLNDSRYKHMGKWGSSNKSYYHWCGVIVEWYQPGKGSMEKTKTCTMWDFTPIICDDYSRLSTGQTNTSVLTTNVHSWGHVKNNNGTQDTKEKKWKSISYVHNFS